jgi:hypothetical protein
MTIVRVKGFKLFIDAHGHARCYHRKTGTPIDLRKSPLGSTEFIAECARIGALGQKAEEKPGLLGTLIRDYRASSAWKDLAPRTQADYHRVFEWLRPIAGTSLKRFSRPLVVKIRDKAADAKGRRFGNYVKAVLSIIFSWGKERAPSMRTMLPALKICAVHVVAGKRTAPGPIKSGRLSSTRRRRFCGRRLP